MKATILERKCKDCGYTLKYKTKQPVLRLMYDVYYFNNMFRKHKCLNKYDAVLNEAGKFYLGVGR